MRCFSSVAKSGRIGQLVNLSEKESRKGKMCKRSRRYSRRKKFVDEASMPTQPTIVNITIVTSSNENMKENLKKLEDSVSIIVGENSRVLSKL
jgi:hypothetical protein